MIVIDCSELSSDEKLALADRISDELSGKALALVKLNSLVIDQLTDQPVGASQVLEIVKAFVSTREDAQWYSVETKGETIMVHSADPVASAHRKRDNQLPPNVKQCPFCPFVTPYEEMYQVHMRSHLFGV